MRTSTARQIADPAARRVAVLGATSTDGGPSVDPARLLPEHACQGFALGDEPAERLAARLAREGFDVVVNLCDSGRAGARRAREAIEALESSGLAFTGSTARFHGVSQVSVKIAAHSAGVRVPAYVEITADAARRPGLDSLRFPLVVRPSTASEAAERPAAAVAQDAAGLDPLLDAALAASTRVLVEEQVAGRAFSVLVTEPRGEGTEPWTLIPIERLPPTGGVLRARPRLVPVADPALARALGEAAAATFLALGGDGYALADLRLDPAGAIYLLGLLPNCPLLTAARRPSLADRILANHPGGPAEFLRHLLVSAERRRDRLRPAWHLAFDRGRGFGLYADRDLAPGEVAVGYEEQPVTLVSRAHVERNWRGLRKLWFNAYAWPVSSEAAVIWSERAGDWRPINHSCDPNTWLSGLDLVARRAIRLGEELTVDYATFCGPGMASFDCACGSPGCRLRVHGSDHLRPELARRYEGHVSDFVRAAQAAVAPGGDAPYEIRPAAVGVGLFAARAWARGEVVSRLGWGPRHPKPTRWTVQVDELSHAEPQPFELRYVNHSCAPNVRFDIEGSVLRAIRDIQPGDELAFAYPSTEWRLAEPFACRCGATSCLGSIRGAESLDPAALETLGMSAVVRRLKSAG